MSAKIVKPLFSVVAAGAILGVAFLLTGYTDSPTLLKQIKHKGELVVVTRNSPTTYYEGPFGPTGFEYDLARAFANYLGVRLKVVVAPNFQAILPMVARREAHLAAAGLTVTEGRRQRVRFGPSYDRVTQQLVYRGGTAAPQDPDDLAGGLIEVITGSSHAERLRALAADDIALQWRENPEADSDELLAKVWNGEIAYTVADSNEVQLNRRFYPELRVAFELSAPEELAWAFAKGGDDSLYRAAQAFFAWMKESGRLEQLRARYYGHAQDFDYVGTRQFLRHVEERLPDYLPVFREAAASNSQDWRLLAAVGYQESHWDPKAISPTGVRGIMMLTRTTAADLGIKNRIDPDNSIRGGARYLRRIKRRIPHDIPEPDRTWFTLAAYNVGLGHLEDARKITRERGGDPNRWSDVKENLPLLMRQRWHRGTQHGYARGLEAVRYVENVRTYYDILLRHADRVAPPTQEAAADPAVESPLTQIVSFASPVL